MTSFCSFHPISQFAGAQEKEHPGQFLELYKLTKKNCCLDVIDFSRLWQKNHFVPVRSGFTDFLKFSRLSVCRAQKSSQNRFLRLLCGFQDKTLGSIFWKWISKWLTSLFLDIKMFYWFWELISKLQLNSCDFCLLVHQERI